MYYIQYAHARIHSIYNQVREAGIAFGDYSETDFTTLTSEMELELIKKLAEYPEEVVQSAEHRAPHRIARYLYDLASMFHSFYRQGRNHWRRSSIATSSFRINHSDCPRTSSRLGYFRYFRSGKNVIGGRHHGQLSIFS